MSRRHFPNLVRQMPGCVTDQYSGLLRVTGGNRPGNSVIIKKIEGIIAKFDNSKWLTGSIGEDPRSGVSIRSRQV